MGRFNLRSWIVSNLILILLVLLVAGLAAMVGPKSFSIFSQLSPEDRDILFVSRIPRVLLGAIAGIALGAAGCAFQGLLQNSLADPYILGVSSGAALGSILALALNLPFAATPFLAFGTAMAAMAFVYLTASTRRQISPHTLLLTGVVFNAFLFAFILILKGLLSFEHGQKILFILIGTLEAESYGRLLLSGLLVLIGLLILMAEGQALNLLSASHETAATQGLDVERHRRRIFFSASLMIGAVVPLTGLIGFVGLFVPHIARLLFGPDHRTSVAASAWIGAILLILCDTVARTALVVTPYQTELPVGAVTAVVGAPFFLTLLKRRRS